MSLAQTLALQQALKNQQAQQAQAKNSQPAPAGTMSPTGPDPATTPYRVVPHQDGSSSLYVQQGYKATVVNQTTNPETGAVTRQYAIEPVLPQSTSQPISNDLFSGKRQGQSLGLIDMGTSQPIIKTNEQRLETLVTVATLPLGGSGGLALSGGKTVAVNLAKNAIIGGGISAGLEYVTTGKVTVENVAVGAASGVILGNVGGKIVEKAGFVGKGLVDSVGRVGVNTLLGGVAGTGMEAIKTGKVSGQGFIEGAAYGTAFGVAGEAIGAVGPKLNQRYDITNKIQKNIPVLKYGNVEVPIESSRANIPTESAAYRGLYLSKGAEAKILTGKVSSIPKGSSIKEGYVPESNIESTITQKVMLEAGYAPESLQAVKDVRMVMGTTENIRPKTIDDIFPAKTQTLSEKGTTIVKDYVRANESSVDMVYGSYATKPQLSKSFEYVVEGKSALREPGDIDIQLNVGQKQAESFASDLVLKLKAQGEPVRVSPEKSTLIESDVGKGDFSNPADVHHSVDIHFKDEAPIDVMTPTSGKAWGYTFTKQPVKIEKINAMALNEQGLRKGASILGFKEEQGIGPKSHRVKDIPDFFQAQRTLLEQSPNTKASTALERASNYFGAEDIKAVKDSQFIYTPNKSSSVPRIYASNMLSSSKQKTSQSKETSQSVSPSKNILVSQSKGLSPSLKRESPSISRQELSSARSNMLEIPNAIKLAASSSRTGKSKRGSNYNAFTDLSSPSLPSSKALSESVSIGSYQSPRIPRTAKSPTSYRNSMPSVSNPTYPSMPTSPSPSPSKSIPTDYTRPSTSIGLSQSSKMPGLWPESKFENDKPNRALAKEFGLGKRVRYYAVADPLKVAGEFF